MVASGAMFSSAATAASTAPRMALAAMSAADAGFPAGGTFGGQPVAGGDVVVAYTFAGDADLNGRLDGDDYFQIDSHRGATGSAVSYHHGDFNYDGAIDGDDYFILDANLGPAAAAATGALPHYAAVPEPAATGVAMIAAASAIRRRRRRHGCR
jgi:hypothetical protein